MKDISVKHSQKTETVDFGPIGRDVILNKKIEDETLRATNKENELEAQITEAGARVKDVKCDGTSIVVDKVADIGPSINAKVLVETNRATAAEGTLQTNIDNETNRAQGAETTLTTNLATEVTNRTNADTTLQNNITEEAQQREEADTALFDSIVAEALARSIADANLQEQVNNLKARGRYLSLWNSTTGLPADNPAQLPYDYKAGDYYIIGTVGTGVTLYKPEGSQYTGTASTTEETREVSVNDVYYFDGTNWAFQSNAQKEVSFSGLAGNPTDNTALATALNDKVDLTSEQTITGTKTFTSEDGISFGSNGYAWRVQYDLLCLKQTGGTGNAVQIGNSFVNLRDVKPILDNYFSLGNTTERWKDLYLSGKISLTSSTNTNWNITTNYAQLVFKKGDNTRYTFTEDYASVVTVKPSINNFWDLGTAASKWKDIYASGDISDGTNSISVANICNKSTVSVSDTGTATDEVGYITIDGVEKKLAGGGSAPSNMVTTDTAQTITGLKTIQAQSNGQAMIFTNGTYSYPISYSGNPTCGMWTVSGEIYPSTNKSYNLGNSSYRWGTVYCNGVSTTGSVTPAADGTLYLGSSSWQWRNICTRGMEIYGGNTSPYSNSPALTFVYKKSGSGTFNNRLTLDSIGSDDLASFRLDGHFSPGADATYNMGYSDLRWKNLYMSGKAYFNNANTTYITTDIWGSLTFVSDSGTIWSNSDIVPSNANGKLGTSRNEWASLYVKDINMNGALSADGSQGTAGQVLTSNGPDAPAIWTNSVLPSTEAAQTVSGNIKICVVTALPENPDANTLYFIKEA